MSSNINPYNVDGTFPIAGQDNSSQGFRDNFTNIRNNFTFAQNEISDLQSKAIVTSALTGQSIINDMAGTQLRRPQLTAWTQSLLDLGVISTLASLDFSLANFQKITTAGPISLAFLNWPASTGAGALGYGLMRIWINVTNIAHTVTLPASVTIAVNDIAGYNSTTNTITFDASGNYIFDFSSTDGGVNYQIFDVTRNRASFRDPGFYYNDMVNSTVLIGYGSASLNTALALEQGEDIVSASGSYNSVSAGTNYTGNVYYTQGDNGPSAGYSITGLRGNLTTGTIVGIQNNDFLGYVNTLTFTGNGTSANVPNSTATIAFYARGSNPTNGLGGNIALFTTPDATGSTPFVATQQAIGIENDQSTHIYGSFYTKSTIVEGGTYLTTLPTLGGSFTANSNISTIIIDSASSATISTANIILPSNPIDRQRLKIVSAAPITTANVWAPASASVKWVPSNKFASGNVSASLTYISSVSTWYVS